MASGLSTNPGATGASSPASLAMCPAGLSSKLRQRLSTYVDVSATLGDLAEPVLTAFVLYVGFTVNWDIGVE
jgi:hypothetical protein